MRCDAIDVLHTYESCAAAEGSIAGRGSWVSWSTVEYFFLFLSH